MRQDDADVDAVAPQIGDRQFHSRAAVAYFLYAVMPVDGETHPKEMTRLFRIVCDDFEIDLEEAQELFEHVQHLSKDTQSMQAMAQVLTADLNKRELGLLVSHLWEMVLVDGRIHEAEIVFVEHVATFLSMSEEEVVAAMNA